MERCEARGAGLMPSAAKRPKYFGSAKIRSGSLVGSIGVKSFFLLKTLNYLIGSERESIYLTKKNKTKKTPRKQNKKTLKKHKQTNKQKTTQKPNSKTNKKKKNKERKKKPSTQTKKL